MFTLLVAGFLAPASARAGHCERYNFANAIFERDLALLVPGDGLSTGPARGLALPISPPAPCKGASCSAPPAAPTAPSDSSISPEQHWACRTALQEPQPLFSLLRDANRDLLLPTRHHLSIFHPPRLLARPA
jgi:hypothetical protein